MSYHRHLYDFIIQHLTNHEICKSAVVKSNYLECKLNIQSSYFASLGATERVQEYNKKYNKEFEHHLDVVVPKFLHLEKNDKQLWDKYLAWRRDFFSGTAKLGHEKSVENSFDNEGDYIQFGNVEYKQHQYATIPAAFFESEIQNDSSNSFQLCKCHLHSELAEDWDCPCSSLDAIRMLNAWQDFGYVRCEYCQDCLWKPLRIPTFYYGHLDDKYLPFFDSKKFLEAITARINLLNQYGFTSFYPLLPTSKENDDHLVVKYQKSLCVTKDSEGRKSPFRRLLQKRNHWIHHRNLN